LTQLFECRQRLPICQICGCFSWFKHQPPPPSRLRLVRSIFVREEREEMDRDREEGGRVMLVRNLAHGLEEAQLTAFQFSPSMKMRPPRASIDVKAATVFPIIVSTPACTGRTWA
jgi:hypothetical protein